MKRVTGIFSTIFNVIHNEINGHVEDKYVNVLAVRPKGSLDKVEKKIVPFARHDEVPDLGPDRDRLIAKAEVLFKNDSLRLKWLQSVYDMRQNNIERIMETIPGEVMKHRRSTSVYHKWAANPVPDAAIH